MIVYVCIPNEISQKTCGVSILGTKLFACLLLLLYNILLYYQIPSIHVPKNEQNDAKEGYFYF